MENKDTGLGVTEFMLSIRAWLCTHKQTNHSGSNGNSQMCIVTGPNIEITTNSPKRIYKYRPTNGNQEKTWPLPILPLKQFRHEVLKSPLRDNQRVVKSRSQRKRIWVLEGGIGSSIISSILVSFYCLKVEIVWPKCRPRVHSFPCSYNDWLYSV